MIVPAPVLWLVHAAWQRSITWRRALVDRAARRRARASPCRCGGSPCWRSRGASAPTCWPTPRRSSAVSLTSTSTETLRGLGYWLFYVRDPTGFATTASVDYMASGTVIVAGFVLLVVCLLGLAVVRWAHRRYAVLLVFTGIVLAVGVHPIGDSVAADVEPLDTVGAVARAAQQHPGHPAEHVRPGARRRRARSAPPARCAGGGGARADRRRCCSASSTCRRCGTARSSTRRSPATGSARRVDQAAAALDAGDRRRPRAAAARRRSSARSAGATPSTRRCPG